MSTFKRTKGFTLVETLVSVAIMVMIGLAISTFEKDIFSINSSLQNNLSAQLDARKVLRTAIAELRSASPSSLGSYTIEQAGTSTLIFYSNIDTDANKERIRYFLSGTDLKRGVIKPSGTPLAYNSGQETFSTVIHDVVNGTSTAIFTYFDTNFYGTTTPLAQPVNPPNVRLIRMTVIIDRDPNRSPSRITVMSQAALRNVKDNL